MIEIISGAWAAGETKTFQIAGHYIEILDAQYSCDVVLMDRTGSQQSFMRGAEASFFTRPSGGFETVQITSAQAQTIRLFVGSGDAGTRRISSTVNVVDGARARTIAGAAFIAGINAQSAAGKIAVAQLRNAPASAKRIVVNRVLLACDNTATAVAFGYIATPISATAGGTMASKMLGGPASTSAQGFTDTASFAAAPPAGVVELGVASVPAGGTFEFIFDEPIVLVPGASLVYYTNAQAATLRTLTHFTEEAI
ncbi:hypothetical protein [uncultured Pseudacidovorax sp.]|uniref:hypothetical protein n=1 Tax=uncultured Pseudacidovorax sp. TaxID=679313 RepID=UPI0025E9F6F7|nr:hypothetical protein [uncultured Pseudacidovorax sp.]